VQGVPANRRPALSISRLLARLVKERCATDGARLADRPKIAIRKGDLDDIR
jgi:hypothetical protein